MLAQCHFSHLTLKRYDMMRCDTIRIVFWFNYGLWAELWDLCILCVYLFLRQHFDLEVLYKEISIAVANCQGLQGIQRIPWNTQIKLTKNPFNYINKMYVKWINENGICVDLFLLLGPCTTHFSGFVLEKKSTNQIVFWVSG